VSCATEGKIGDHTKVGAHLAVEDFELAEKPMVIGIGIILFRK
jgi:hypothetical protein